MNSEKGAEVGQSTPQEGQKENTRIAMAKNDELMDGQKEYLESFGISASEFDTRDRKYLVEQDGLKFYVLPAKDAAKFYFRGDVEAALTGKDWVVDQSLAFDVDNEDFEMAPAETENGRYGQVNLILGSPNGRIPGSPVVASEKEELAKLLIKPEYPSAEVVETEGSTEIYPEFDSIDAYIGVEDTEFTRKQNNMDKIRDYGESYGVWLGEDPAKILE